MVDSMENPSDMLLVERIRRGEQQVFVLLVRRYERSLAALIGRRLGATGDVAAVEDLLQETFVQAWRGLAPGSRAPRNVRAWLYQVARNRCADYLRSAQRREDTVDDEVLAFMVNRIGVVDDRQRRLAADVVEAFETVPERERQALRSFYVDGLSIAEIAARHRCAPGTIKRRLSHGRDWVRGEMGISRRKTDMSTDSRTVVSPFPEERPKVVVERLREKASPVDMRELTWWFVVPELHDEVRRAEYQPIHGGSEWRLTSTNTMRAARGAVLHDRECVEIDVEEQHFTVDGLLDPMTADRHTRVWGRLNDREAEWLGVERLASDGTRKLRTFLDDGFELDWGICPRRIDAGEWLVADEDGQIGRCRDSPTAFADGVFAVRVGEQTLTCTRVVEMEKDASELDVVIFAFVDDGGRTILFRRYDGNRRVARDESRNRRDLLPEAERIVIDGMTFVHSYDYLTAMACGIDD